MNTENTEKPHATASDTPRTDEEFDFVRSLHIAQQRVKSLPYWSKFIDGTPLSNDFAVMIAQAYCEGADHARQLERENAQLRDAASAAIEAGNDGDWQSAEKMLRAALAALAATKGAK